MGEGILAEFCNNPTKLSPTRNVVAAMMM